MAQSLYRKYFEIVPVNNITTFAVNNGTNQISFLIPPVNGAIKNYWFSFQWNSYNCKR